MTTASAGALNVVITGTDRLSPALARMTGGLARLSTSIGRLSGTARVGLGVFDRLAARARGVAVSLAAIVPPLSAITAAGSIAGLYRLASGWSAMGASLGRTAYRVQTTAGQLQVLQGAARLAGASAEDLSAGMEGLGDAVLDAVGGRDDQASMYFRMLGIGLRDAAGNARTASDVLPEVADGIARIANPGLQARVMAALRLPAGLLPFMKDGAAGLRAYEEAARRAGAISEEGAAAARQFEMAQARLSLAGQGLVNVLASRLAPVLVPLLDRLSNWLIEKGPQLGDQVEDLARRFEAWVDGGGLDRLGERLEAVGTSISTVIGWMGGMENAAIALGLVLTARLVAPLVNITGSLAAIAAWRVPVWMLRLLGLGSAPALGGLLLGMTPGTTNSGEQEELDRLRRDPDALAREMQPRDSAPPAERGLLDAWLGRLFPNHYRPAAPRPSPTGSADPRGPVRQGAALDPEIERRVRAAAARHGVDPDFAAHIARIEGGGWNRVSPAGAIGPMQLMPGTARDLRVDPHDPDQNIDGGVRYLAQMLARFGGDRRAAAAAYNAGPNSAAVRHFAETGNALHLPRETQTYLQRLDALGRGAAPRDAAAPRAEAGAAPQQVDVRVTLAGPGTEGATVRTRTPDGGVRIERVGLGATP